MATQPAFGDLLRDWRGHRRMSQGDLAQDVGVSPRHLSFVETGRARPSRRLVLRLAQRLRLLPRECNALLAAAGFAPIFPEHALDDPALAPAHKGIERLLLCVDPFPAFAVDRHWTLLRANPGFEMLMAGVSPELLAPPVNLLRLYLHPAGMAPRIVNLAEWKAHVCRRVELQIDATDDPVLIDLLAECHAYPAPAPGRRPIAAAVAVPLVIDGDGGRLSLIGTTTTFSAPIDVTLAEIVVDAFLPGDAATALALGGTMPGADPAVKGGGSVRPEHQRSPRRFIMREQLERG
ncbi:XRE family transcriptional regulator [Sphingomonas sp. MM-1]|uniref:helix-turn-helix domain-containing protein n=1 Tax=Sphingomonas sp. MM-1 TaxID=745310 RepID=UPI0002C06661|nr:helix-turn-helix transcriptional regulator [Sphingomonas sp. MM-1]AGH50817.1 XRE family transcriptional regulator [Sphingomonas sp. MM-1]